MMTATHSCPTNAADDKTSDGPRPGDVTEEEAGLPRSCFYIHTVFYTFTPTFILTLYFMAAIKIGTMPVVPRGVPPPRWYILPLNCIPPFNNKNNAPTLVP